jgi:hypothetical protein
MLNYQRVLSVTNLKYDESHGYLGDTKSWNNHLI